MHKQGHFCSKNRAVALDQAMTNLIELADIFCASPSAETAAPLIKAIVTCGSIEALEALLLHIGDNEDFDEIVKLIYACIAQLTVARDPQHKKHPSPIKQQDTPSEPANDGPSPF